MIQSFSSCLKKIIIPVFVIFLSGCANVVAPTGGAKDEDPPAVLRSSPPNYSTHYTGQDVRIFFDEFVTLKDLNKNFLVSPPLENDPEVRVRGRSIIMTVEDTLRDNSTYVFFFGESIVDITEGNPIPNFQFVVSTGDYVDSLSVRGRIVNAFTLQPEEGVFVMMYDNVYDSVPMLERPVYVSKTNQEGGFAITNMRDGEYLMFALLDMNFNFLYDNPDEKIAFHDSLVRPTYFAPPLIQKDSIVDDELNGDIPGIDETRQNDDLDFEAGELPDIRHQADTLKQEKTEHPFYELALFKEKDTFQRILATTLVEIGKISMVFRIPADSLVLNEYLGVYADDWYIPEFNETRDTLTLWMPQIAGDSLFLEVSDRGEIIDSVRISLVPRQPRGRRVVEDTVPPVLNLRAISIKSGNVYPYFSKFTLEAESPIQSANFDQIEFFINDSLPIKPDFRFTDDIKRRIEVTNDLYPDTTYRILIPPGTITDIFGRTNDTTEIRFTTDNPELYGSVLVNMILPDPERQYILQLLNANLETISEKNISEDKTYIFHHLSAGNYRLRLIHDLNRNGKWDTGNYLERTQPEPVSIYEDEVTARLNWEVEVIWSLSTENPTVNIP
jgi:hypothetical protein